MKKEKKEIPFFPNHCLKEVIAAYIIIGILITLAVLLPFGLEEKANPLDTPEGIKPEWYFIPTYQALKYVPKALGIIGFTIAGIVFVIFPFIDKSKNKNPFVKKLGIIVITISLIFGFLGVISERKVTIFGTKYEIDLKGIPHKK